MSAKFGHCLRELDDHQHAIKFAERSLKMNDGFEQGCPSRTRLHESRSPATTAGATAEPGGSERPVPRSQRSASPGSPAASRC